ncbi:MAG: 50S ribosomal protein L13 [Candidatus Thermoplasmatota archaeon]|nr:50S ribosomal protein L13 [Candidatus Thermoplasmatota archaeon]
MNDTVYLDGNGCIYGKISAYVARKLLNGNNVVIVNANRVVITGSRDFILDKFLSRRDIGSVRKGPYYPRTADQILRRSIRGMLPMRNTKGRDALKNCMVYTGVPKDLKGGKFERIDSIITDKVTGFITLAEISRHLGAKVKE